MAQRTIEDKLDELIRQYAKKDISEKEVRDIMVRDIVNMFAAHAKLGMSKGVTMMTQEASAYNPKTDSVPVKPKGL